MTEVLEQWIKNVKTYPPAEIFFQKTGPKFEKAVKKRLHSHGEDSEKA